MGNLSLNLTPIRMLDPDSFTVAEVQQPANGLEYPSVGTSRKRRRRAVLGKKCHPVCCSSQCGIAARTGHTPLCCSPVGSWALMHQWLLYDQYDTRRSCTVKVRWWSFRRFTYGNLVTTFTSSRYVSSMIFPRQTAARDRHCLGRKTSLTHPIGSSDGRCVQRAGT